MADLNANLILEGTQQALQAEPQAVNNYQSQQLNAQNLASGAMNLQQQRMDMTDNQKLTMAMNGVDAKVGDPDYADKVSAALKTAGVSGKTQLGFQQEMLKTEQSQLQNKQALMGLAETQLKMNSQEQAFVQEQMDKFTYMGGSIMDAYNEQTKDNKNPAAAAQAGVTAGLKVQQMFKDEQDEINGKLANGSMDKKTYTDMMQGLQKAQGIIFQGGKFNPQAMQTVLDQNQQLRAVKKELLSEKDTQSQIKLRDAQAGAAGRQVVVGQDANGNPTYAVVDKGTGNVAQTGEKVAPKPVAGGEMSAAAGELQAAFAKNGVPIPAGLAGFGTAGKTQFFENLIRTSPGETPQQIAQDVKGGKLDTAAAVKEVGVVAQRAAAVTSAMAGIFTPNGEAETVLKAADAAGLSDVKGFNYLTDKAKKALYSNPKWAAYKTAHGELVASMAQVFSRGGASSVHAQEEAAHMFPENSSKDEIEAQLAVSRQVADSIVHSDERVLTALKEGKPLGDILVPKKDGAKTDDTPSANTPAPAAAATSTTKPTVSNW